MSSYALNQTEEGYKAAKADLVKEFGDVHTVARAYLRRIETWKPIAANDSVQLKSFSAFLRKCRGSMPSLRHLQQLNTDLYLQKIVSKLSMPIQASWRKMVDQLEQSSKDVTFSDLVDFIERQSRIAKHPVFSASALQESDSKSSKGLSEQNSQVRAKANLITKTNSRAVLATNAVESVSPASSTQLATVALPQQSRHYQRECPKCKKHHDLDDCEEYMNMTVEERRRFVAACRLCFGCYGQASRNHTVRSCKRRRKCQVCGRAHPTGLHRFRPVVQSERENSTPVAVPVDSGETQLKTVSTCASATEASSENVAMNIVMVQLAKQADPSTSVKVYAALDSMSTACFVSRDIWTKLGCPGEATEIIINTVTGSSKQETRVITGLRVTSMQPNESEPISLPRVYMQDMLPIKENEIPSHSSLLKYSHLSHLVNEIPDRDPSIPVGLLIGVNCPKAL